MNRRLALLGLGGRREAGIKGIRVLAEQTLGFIGLGENSGEVARRMRMLGMRVLYYKRNRLSAADEQALGGVEYVSLDQLLAQSDFVSIHVPYGKETEKMIGRDALAKMKPDAYLVNSARGGIVDVEHATRDVRRDHDFRSRELRARVSRLWSSSDAGDSRDRSWSRGRENPHFRRRWARSPARRYS
jgi:hypothetical protein